MDSATTGGSNFFCLHISNPPSSVRKDSGLRPVHRTTNTSTDVNSFQVNKSLSFSSHLTSVSPSPEVPRISSIDASLTPKVPITIVTYILSQRKVRVTNVPIQ